MVDDQLVLIIDAVLQNSGVTVDVSSGEHATSGFIVAVEGSSFSVPSHEFFSDGVGIIDTYISKHRLHLVSEGKHLGLWHDRESSVVVLDIVEQLDSRVEVIKLAVERNQDAVYDIQQNELIITK